MSTITTTTTATSETTISTIAKGKLQRSTLQTALIIARREIRDSLKDWRIVAPIIILTMIFPFVMNMVSDAALGFVLKHGGQMILTERLNPFLLMVVGFFPISVSLVIALESFVGEKERSSLEPLLSAPISDTELYVGKMLSSLILPLGASYLGIAAYLTGIWLLQGWWPGISLLVQMVCLTTTEGLVMVSAAVVVSSQTTSVRAANLLASFIIIPMAFLVQGESVLMFWADYGVLWVIILGLLVVDMILIRMGVRIFNREEILSKEMDELNLKSIWRDFRGYFMRPTGIDPKTEKPILFRFYAHDIPAILKESALPSLIVLVTLVAAAVMGWYYSDLYPIPKEAVNFSALNEEAFQNMPELSFMPSFTSGGIFFHNVRSLVASAVLAIFSFGSLALILLMAPIALASFFAFEVASMGHNPWVFLATFILPHGIVEIPAAIIATSLALKLGAGLVSPSEGLDVGQAFLKNLADFTKVFLLLVMPMLLAAAIIEANISPLIIISVYK